MNEEEQKSQEVKIDNPCACEGVGTCPHGNVYDHEFRCIEVNQVVGIDETQTEKTS